MSRPSATFRSSVIGLLPHVQRGHLAQRQSVALPPPLRQFLALRAQLQPRGVGIAAPHAERDGPYHGNSRITNGPIHQRRSPKSYSIWGHRQQCHHHSIFIAGRAHARPAPPLLLSPPPALRPIRGSTRLARVAPPTWRPPRPA